MLFIDVAGVITDDLELVNEEVNDFEKIHRMRIVFCIIFLCCQVWLLNKMKKRVKRNEKRFSRVLLKNQYDEILILKDRSDTWNSPGGKQELGESALECAIREMKEELAVGKLLNLKKFFLDHSFLIQSFGKDIFFC